MHTISRKAALAAFIPLSLLTLGLGGCERFASHSGSAAAGEASSFTRQANAAMAASLPLADKQDFDDATRGLIARPTGKLLDEQGRVLLDYDAYGFEDGTAAAPATVNPSLWRHAQLNAQTGLFKVVDGVYQLRGFDMSNITLIEGRTGWIVVDALTSRESARAALAFARQHLGNKPVTAIVFSHSHLDHFGGVLGVVTPAEVAQRRIPVVASNGFMEEATSENVMVGTAMGRRSLYQFGRDLPDSPTGNVDTGLGKRVAYGSFGILPPNVIVDQPTQELELDGVRFIFHNVPGAEAPAELSFSVPQYKAYCAGENLVQTMHNLLPVRGAKVRDALRWSAYMQEALDQLGDAQVLLAQHNWPTWGHDNIARLITAHRDVYKYTHDQTVRMINAGLSPDEIAEKIRLPASLATQFGARGYYGDVRHNARAVYQFYLGNYDGNPAHLDRLPQQDRARHYVELLGGSARVVAAAQAAFDKGEYRWVAELLNQAVMADGNAEARELLARTYEQLAYAAEASTWRNSYLSAAHELRDGPPKAGVDRASFVDMLAQTPPERFLESIEASVDGAAAEGRDWKINLNITDTHEQYVLWIENAVMHHRRVSEPAKDANASLALTRAMLVKVVAGQAGMKDMVTSPELKTSGSTIDLVRFFGLADKAKGTFPIVTR